MIKTKISYLAMIGLIAFSCGEQDVPLSKKQVDNNSATSSTTPVRTSSAQPSTGSCGQEETTTIFYDVSGGGQFDVTTTAIPCADVGAPEMGYIPTVQCSSIVLPSSPTNGQKQYITNSCWQGGLTLYYSSVAGAWVFTSPSITPYGAPSSPYNGLNYQYNIPGTTQYYHYVYLTSVGFISAGWYVVYSSYSAILIS
jgi:hypothetical protein